VTTQLTLVTHAATAATRRAAFPSDEPVESPPAPASFRADLVTTSPALACRQTASALGLTATVDDALRDCDHGHWRGRSLDEVAATEPLAVRSWLTDPAAAPHGGESVLALLARVAAWLDALPRDHERIVAVTHPAVVKAAVVHAILATPLSFWRIDVPPLSRTVLSGRPSSWTLRSLARVPE
jgi:broad specificity phosphatase PhoE